MDGAGERVFEPQERRIESEVSPGRAFDGEQAARGVHRPVRLRDEHQLVPAVSVEVSRRGTRGEEQIGVVARGQRNPGVGRVAAAFGGERPPQAAPQALASWTQPENIARSA